MTSLKFAASVVVVGLTLGCGGTRGHGPVTPQGQTELVLDAEGSGLATLKLPSLDALIEGAHGSGDVSVVEGPDERGSEVSVRVREATDTCFSMHAFRSENLEATSTNNLFAMTEEQLDDNPYDEPERLQLHTSGGLVLQTSGVNNSAARAVAVDVSVPAADGTSRVERETVMFYTFESCFDVPAGALREAEWIELVTQLPARRETFRFTLRT